MDVEEPEQIEKALFEYHLELGTYILERLGSRSLGRIAEIGSGPGTFTIPLLILFEKGIKEFYCVDSYTGPYAKDKDVLLSRLKNEGFQEYVKVIEKDATEIDKILSDMDLIIGHEVLCDLNSEQVDRVIGACSKSLVKGGMFIHSELSPHANNRSEELLQILNKEYSDEPISDTTWFSPTADELAGVAQRLGFTSISVEYRKIPIRFLGAAALEMIRRWKINESYRGKHLETLNAVGIEYPMEQILFCTW
jgi:SAM-dependent methyltransferase